MAPISEGMKASRNQQHHLDSILEESRSATYDNAIRIDDNDDDDSQDDQDDIK